MSVTVGMLLCEQLSQGGWEAELKCLNSLQNSPAGMGASELRPYHPQSEIPAHLPLAGRNTVSLLGLCPSGGELVELADWVPVGASLLPIRVKTFIWPDEAALYYSKSKCPLAIRV